MYTVYVDWLYKDICTVQGLPTKEQFCSLDLNEENIHTYIKDWLCIRIHIRTVLYMYTVYVDWLYKDILYKDFLQKSSFAV